MTDREKAIVMAYTGIAMLVGDKFSIYHKYIEDICGRPIYTHEIAFLAEKIKEKSRADFIELCREETHEYDCISRRKAIHVISAYNGKSAQIEALEKLPSVKPQEQKPGHWIMHIDDLFPAESTMECSECGKHQPLTIDGNYCPNCGARMEG